MSSEPVDTPSDHTPEGAERDAPVVPPASAAPAVSAPSDTGVSAVALNDADASEDGEDSEAAAGDAPAGDGTTKRKRRRRRKKKGGEAGASSAGDVPAADGAPPAKKREKRDPAQLPLARFFDPSHSKKHAFAVGEIVAGRVVRVADGTVTVDLFGKATAYCDEREPKEVEERPPEPEAAPTAAAVEGAPTATEGATDPDATTSSGDVAALAALADESSTDDTEGEGEADAGATEGAPPTVAELPAQDAEYEIVVRKPGEIFRGRVGAVAESGHIAIINRVVNTKAAKQRIEAARNERRRVMGLVYGFNRGGFDVLVEGGVRAFCPAGGLSLHPIDDIESLLGKKLEFSLPPLKQGGHGVIVSRRSILEKEAQRRARERVKELKPGQRLSGVVTSVRDFGVFVDLGGVEGLVHQSELSWDRGVRPSDVAKAGETVEVQVLKVHERDGRKEKVERVSLSLKALTPDPWDVHVESLIEGTVRKGKVVRVAEFGAFVELAPMVDGLLHVSELGRDVKSAALAIKVGDEIDVVIERVDRKGRRVGLSRLSAADARAIAEAQAAGDSAEAKVLRPGTNTKVKVDRVEHHGVFVQVVGVIGKRGRGYIANADMATERGTDHRKQFPVGTEFEVKILGLDRDGSLRCSRKAYFAEEEKRAIQEYRREASKQGLGTFGDLMRAKLGGKLPG